MKKISNTIKLLLQKFWHLLTSPVEKLPKAEDTRRAMVVSAFLLFSAISVAMEQVVAGNTPLITLFTLIGGYILARTRWYKLAALLLVTSLIFPSYIVAITTTDPVPIRMVSSFAWVMIPILLTSLIFSVRSTSIIVLASILSLMALPFFRTELSYSVLSGAIGYVSLTSIILLIVMIQRNNMESDRQKELRNSQERFHKIFHLSPDLIAISEVESGKLIDVNESYTSAMGYTKSECIGATTRELNMYASPIDRSKMVELLAETGNVHEFETELKRKDGSVFQASASVASIELDGNHCLIWMGRDITKRKEVEAERETFIKELEARNIEMERFTYTVSHDLKSPLVTIKGFVEMLQKDIEYNNKDRIRKDIKRIADAARKMGDLLSDLLNLSRVGRILNPLEEVELAVVVKEAIELLDASIQSTHAIIQVAPNLPIVYSDRTRLREVIENLIDNATKYMGEQSNPTIEIGLRSQKGEQVIYVKDNGIGIDAAYHEKVFGLFEKLDPTSEGTGVGLALVKRIIETNGGKIWVESEGLGKGSTFCFTISDPR